MAENNNRVTVAKLGVRVSHLERGMDDLRETVEGMNGKLTAILVSIATAAVLLAINIIIGTIGATP